MATKSNGCSLSNRVFSDGFVDVSDCINQHARGSVLHPSTCLIVLKHNIMLVPVRIDAYARSHARAQVYILAHYNHDTTVTAILAAQLPAGTIIATIVINVMVIQSSSSAIAFAVVIIMMIMSPWIRLVRVSVRAVLRDVHGAVVMPIGAAVAFEHFLRTVRRALGQRLVRAIAGVLGSGHASGCWHLGSGVPAIERCGGYGGVNRRAVYVKRCEVDTSHHVHCYSSPADLVR